MKHFAISCFLLTAVLQLQAQPDTINLQDVTISVTPFEQRLSQSTGSLSILQVSPTALPTINIADQLNTAPGVYMPSGTYTTNRLTIRGVGSRTPYSSNRIRAYFEEIPLTNGDGISTVEDVDIAGISRMEILKGPASAMYGSGLGGVVRLKAAYPSQQGLSARVFSRFGSFNTWKNGIHIGWKQGNTTLTGGYARASSDGFRENNRYTRDHLYLHGRTAGQKNSFSWHLLTTRLYAQIPSSLNATDFTESPHLAASNWLAVGGYESYSKATGGATWTHTFNEYWQHRLTLFSAWQDPYESRPFNILDDVSAMAGIRDFVQYENRNFRVQSGIELFHESYRWKIIETLSGAEGDLQLHNSETRRYGNAFAHALWSPIPKLNLEGGFNLNLLKYTIQTRYHIDNANQSGSYSYNPVLSPRVGLNYAIAQDHFVHAAAGHGFSAPSLEETLLPEGLVNPDLKPETGWNLDVGIRGWIWDRKWYYDITAYAIYLRNMLVTKRVTEEIFSGINAGSARLSGIEIFNRVDLDHNSNGGQWSNSLSASIFLNSNRFTEFIDDGADYSGNALPGIPAQMVHTEYDILFRGKAGLTTGVQYTGSQFMNDDNTAVYDGHLTASLKASYNITLQHSTVETPSQLPPPPSGHTRSLRITAGINNVFNTHHASMILVNAPSFGSNAPRYYYPGMPRNFYVGISLEL
jgi:iron complex outermembrane recepter protein